MRASFAMVVAEHPTESLAAMDSLAMTVQAP